MQCGAPPLQGAGATISMTFSTADTASRGYALVVDDHPLVARGITEFLRAHALLADAVGVGGTQEALTTIARLGPPSVALVDFWLADGTTATFLADLRTLAPRARVLMMSGDGNPAVVTHAAGNGAHGFLHKQQPPEVFAQAVRAVLEGGTWFDAATPVPAAGAAQQQQRDVPLYARDLGLTPRQGQILEQVLEGHPNRRIAQALHLSEHTVKEHVTAILQRLQVRNRVEAIAKLRGVQFQPGLQD